MPADLPKIHVFLAHSGISSRRKAEEFIAAGQVTVNGEIATIGMRVDPAKDIIKFNGELVSKIESPVSYLIYKPNGILSTTQDELGRDTVIDYLQKQLGDKVQLPRLYPVGRLDLDSEGLMILTNDGDLANRLTHPSFEITKTYRITIEGQPTGKALAHLERGVRLQEGMTSPAQIQLVDQLGTETQLDITIHEGRYHQVKRMMLRVGYEVIKLVRIQMGPFSLADLQGQKVRLLTPAEMAQKFPASQPESRLLY